MSCLKEVTNVTAIFERDLDPALAPAPMAASSIGDLSASLTIAILNWQRLPTFLRTTGRHYAQIPRSQDHSGVRSAAEGSIATQEHPKKFT
jgi:hypothetical protein